MSNILSILQKILDFFKSSSSNNQPSPVQTPIAPPVQVAPTAPVEPTPPAKPSTSPELDTTDTPEQTGPIKPVHPAPSSPLVRLQYTKLEKSKDGSGGFCYNPANSRNTLKVIFPAQYTDQIVEVVAQSVKEKGPLLERLTNAQPSEWGNRERYYGRRSLDQYPKKVIIVIRLVDGTIKAWQIDDVSTRQD